MPKSTNTSPPSRRRRQVFRLLAVLLPVVIAPLAVETGLRWTGFGYSPGFLQQKDGVLTENYHFTWRFFPNAVARAPQPIRMTAQPENRRRIVIYGESAAMGDPEPAIGLPRMLEVLMEQRFPDARFEIVNTAVTAINSWAIADIASDLSGTPADLAIIYMGNNEVVGPFGAGTVFGQQAPAAWWVRTQLALRRTRTGQWLKSRSEERAAPAVWQGMEMFLDHQVPEESPALGRVRESFTDNVHRIVETCRKTSPVLVSMAAVNLRDCPPFASLNNSGSLLPADDAGLTTLEEKWAADRGGAEITWRLAQARLASGITAGAKELFSKARDLDTLRFRCDSVMQAKGAAGLAGMTGVTVVDAQAYLDLASPGGIAGHEFFHEHVHLTPQGSWKTAVLFAGAAVTALKLTPATPGWADLDTCLQRLVFTPWHEVRLLEEMRGRLRNAPFATQTGHAARMARLEQEITDGKKALTPAMMKQWGEAALKTCATHPGDWRAAMQAALLLEAAGRTEALALLASAAEAMPHQVVFQQQGATLNRFKRYGEAEPILRKALALRPEFPAAWHSLGISLSHLKREPEAIAAWRKALALAPDYSEARRALAGILLQQKDTAGAETQFRALLAANDDDAAIHNQLGSLLTASGRLAEALPHYVAVVRLLPRDANAHINAGTLHARLGLTAEAERLLRRALELDPGNPTVVGLLSQLSTTTPASQTPVPQ